MTLRDSVSVRLSGEIRERLDQLSQQCGLSCADLIRRATEDYLMKIAKDGFINIPVEISTRSGQVAVNGGVIHNHYPAKLNKRKKVSE